ncbi:MAG: ABC transporter ATP-binding protein [Chlamydiia bacterium]|nr:ABC transporter ATP-binding protein [Chlamydiia bacterium]
MTPTLQATQLRKAFTFPTYVDLLKGIDLTVNPGESVAIIGRSGEGKSTLLQILGTLDSPTSGSLAIAGQPVTFANTSTLRNRHLGFIFQSYHLLEDYTVLDNVLFPAKIGRRSNQKQRALDLLDQVGLSSRAHHPARLLSGGEKQRTAIARAFINDPCLILADEPTGNLDRASADLIHNLLFNCVRLNNKSLILVTHDPTLASLCDQQVELVDGQLSGQA